MFVAIVLLCASSQKSELKSDQIFKIFKLNKIHIVDNPFSKDTKDIFFPGSKVKPRPIVARFQFWKQKDHVIRAARKSKPKNITFYGEFAKVTSDRRREWIPELIQRCKDRQRVFLVMDKIVHARSIVVLANQCEDFTFKRISKYLLRSMSIVFCVFGSYSLFHIIPYKIVLYLYYLL